MRRKTNTPRGKQPSTEALARNAIRIQAALAILPVLVGKAGALPVDDLEARRIECERIVADAWSLAHAFVELGKSWGDA